MSRTRKKYSPNPFRLVRGGHRRAVRNGVRKRAIPPTSLDEPYKDRQCWLPKTIAFGLHRKGWDDDKIIRHIRWKFKMSQKDAEEIVPDKDYWWFGCVCEECKRRKAEWVAKTPPIIVRRII